MNFWKKENKKVCVYYSVMSKASAYLRLVVLLALLSGILMTIGMYVAGTAGLVFALVLSLIINFFSYYFSDKIVLAMYGAKEFDDSEINYIVEELARKAGIPKPKVYIVDSMQPNAFATGRNPEHSAVCVTSGLIQLLDADEIEGVLSHEISHIKNRDVLVSTIAASLASAISFLADMLFWSSIFGGENREGESSIIGYLIGMILAPIAATIIQLSISRSREFLADETGAKICGKPLALASALKKISIYAKNMPMSKGSPSTAHMWIINPFSSGFISKLFSTHPPVEERIARLEKLAREMKIK